MLCYRQVVLAAWTAALILPASRADAGSRDVIVVESYDGQRPQDADRLLTPLLGELDTLGFRVGLPLAERIDKALSAPASAGKDEVDDALRAADRGWSDWLDGEFEAAIKELSAAVEVLQASPAAFARMPAYRDVLQRSLVGLALAHKRLNHGYQSQAAMAEAVRSFPDREIGRAAYGPEAHELYRQVEAEMRDQQPASLRVAVDDAGAAVFLNERFAGTGEVLQRNLPPGRYRVYVQRGGARGRLHVVDVAAGSDRVISVDTALDSSLRTTRFVGLQFIGSATRADLEAGQATAIARETGASGVIVVSITELNGRRSIVGTLLSLDSGKPQRSAAVAVQPSAPADATVRALAHFLAGDEPAPELMVAAPRADVAATHATTKPGSRFGGWAWLTAGVGVVAIAGGVVLMDLDGPIYDDQNRHTPDEYRTRTPGIALAVSGGLAVGTGLVMWLLDRRRGDGVEPVVAPNGSGGWSAGLEVTF